MSGICGVFGLFNCLKDGSGIGNVLISHIYEEVDLTFHVCL